MVTSLPVTQMPGVRFPVAETYIHTYIYVIRDSQIKYFIHAYYIHTRIKYFLNMRIEISEEGAHHLVIYNGKVNQVIRIRIKYFIYVYIS